MYFPFSLVEGICLAPWVTEGEERRVNDNKIVLKILRDIMENYENFDHRLKSNYPSIIVDVINYYPFLNIKVSPQILHFR